jgi:hypothetical protein
MKRTSLWNVKKEEGGKYLTNAFVPIEGDKVFSSLTLSFIFSLVI